ncbi:MAG: zf-HC2 domain-containing protein [Chloroflexi bacterium]|nr:zf-HC2 domain-containing protein [Chloroflexota bacterium]
MNTTDTCNALVASLSDYVDGTLDPSLCIELEQHLQSCQKCRIVVNTLRKTIELYHEPTSSEALPQDVRARLFLRLNLEDYLKKEV